MGRITAVWPVLTALACGGGSPSPKDSGTPDTSAPSDTRDSEDTADPGEDTGDDTASTDTGEPPVLPDDGHVGVVWTRTTGDPPTAFVVAQLHDELDPGVPGVHFAKPGSVDTCALTLYTLDELSQGVLPTYQPYSAGPLTLTGPSGEVTVDYAGGEYYRDLEPAAVPLGASYAVSSPGGDFPALAGELEVPSGRELTQPGAGFLASGALEVRWTGGDPGELVLRLEARNTSGERGFIQCRLDNDGEHVIPAALVDQLPSGRATLHLDQSSTRRVAAGTRRVRFYGSVVNLVVGDVP